MESPAFSTLDGCENWLAGLPADAEKAYPLLAAELRRVIASDMDPMVKLEVYEAMRPRVFQSQNARGRRCHGRPVPLDAALAQTLQEVTGLWRALGDAYRTFISDMAGSTPDLAGHAALISQRAVRCYGLAMAECNRAYHAVPAGIWQSMHEVYAFAESAGALDADVDDTLGRALPATSAGACYVHVLLEQLAQPDSLSVDQMNAVVSWLDRWEKLPRLSAQPPSPAPAGQTLIVDPGKDKGPEFTKDACGATVRYLDTFELAKTLRQVTAAVRKQPPAQLGLGDMPGEACERLLMVLHIQWCAAGTGRLDERKPASVRVMVSPNVASIHFHLTGKPFKQPGAEFSSSDRQRANFMGETVSHSTVLASSRSSAVDNWDIVNQSASGFLGMNRLANEAVPITHGQVIGLQPGNKAMHLGIVQRLAIDGAGGIWVGLRLVPGTPQAVAVRTAGTPAAAPGKYDRGLLLPEDAARKVPASLVLMSGWFKPGAVLDLNTGPDRKIKLLSLLDQGPGFERVSFATA